ncbi:class A beta-lactamase [Sphingobacterium sp. HJSM2_6]|uniref:class A beta-lactamase n=1 Tax=Sphingobacterium sp. HJSM2_6 TaxID=3366264 RepID=UPI003BEE7D18
MRNILVALIFPILFFVSPNHSAGQSLEALKHAIKEITKKYQAKVGVAIHNDQFTDSLVNFPETPFPLQSVYKFHLGIVVLNQVDLGKLKLDEVIVIPKEKLNSDLYSPIKDQFPNGTSLTIAQLIQYSIAESDNIACDLLFDLVGGPLVAQQYFEQLGYRDLNIKYTEEVQQAQWDLQFENWTTVGSCNRILHDYYLNKNQLLSPASHQFLWEVMKSTITGKNRLKGMLPKNTTVAHKTGYSGKNKATGIIAAVNDVGIVMLPNNRHFYISVFVTDSKEDEPTNAKIIAEIAKTAYAYFQKFPKK